jgi:hypothetical protein
MLLFKQVGSNDSALQNNTQQCVQKDLHIFR